MKESCEAIEKIMPLLDVPTQFKAIEKLLTEASNLPGPRGNLTLAYKFAECFEREDLSKEQIALLMRWVNLSEEEAPTNAPKEYLPFCGILALGAHYYYANQETKHLIMKAFKLAMNDNRWRTREGAAMGFQLIAEKDFSPVKEYFFKQLPYATELEKRAFVAALAHPPILKDKEVARFSLQISAEILKSILTVNKEKRREETFKVLSKGLEYSLSVFAAALPEEGFNLFKSYAKYNDPGLNKIIKSNLGKSRLAKKYGEEIDEILKIMV